MRRRFVEVLLFRKAMEGFGAEIIRMIQMEILKHPEDGDLLQGCGGVRKMRVALPGQGKRGAMRVLYLDLPHQGVCFLLYAYPKSEKENISSGEKQLIRRLVSELKAGV
ncbi:MAG: type II toxin-antitoxin system RelE/ParE family toxin [Bdellovibrionaceae bacterium]|nr:type II toxin-antitoxin system RelE/ParE family toxin [Pseudobdellovibrionaceae bacterium]